jgi:hypothetical protein
MSLYILQLSSVDVPIIQAGVTATAASPPPPPPQAASVASNATIEVIFNNLRAVFIIPPLILHSLCIYV